MAQEARWMRWQKRLLQEAKIAYERGQKLTFIVNKREGNRKWRIYRTLVVANGEEEYFEEGD